VNVTGWLKMISGGNREWYADLSRLGLSLASLPYGLVSELRNRAYHCGAFPVRGVSVPVISVGNLTVGGTGKTPTVAWVVRQLKELGEHPAILSRGYRALDDSENDEKKLLDSLCQNVPHQQGPDRLKSAAKLLSGSHVTVFVLDDGFQHRRMHRDLDIVLLDALNPFGYGHLLPRGLLRERCAGLSRADLVLLTRCDLIPAPEIESIRQTIRRWTSAPILRTQFEPTGFVNGEGKSFPLGWIDGKKVFAFCGIGNPEGFRQTLSVHTAIENNQFASFPDHHHYTGFDLSQLHRQAQKERADIFITTRKDLVKLPVDGIHGLPCLGLEIELKFLDDPQPLFQMLRLVFSPADREFTGSTCRTLPENR